MSTADNAKIIAFPESEVSLREAFLRGLNSMSTRSVYASVLNAFDRFLGRKAPLAATRRDVEAYMAHLRELGRAPATIQKHLCALSSYFEYAVEEDELSRNPVQRVRRPKVSDVSPRRPLSPAEVQAMLRVCDLTKPVGVRDRAMLALLAVQGWRIAEVLGLSVEDIAQEQGHNVATVHGKGGKVVRVPLAGTVVEAITTWSTVAGLNEGTIFVPVDRGGVPAIGKAISQQAAWGRIRLLARLAGIQRGVHAHLFRHTAVTEALAAGVPLHQVQDFARHSDPSTTRRYDGHRQSLNNPACHILASKFTVGATADIIE